jgi:hypothetical protein
MMGSNGMLMATSGAALEVNGKIHDIIQQNARDSEKGPSPSCFSETTIESYRSSEVIGFLLPELQSGSDSNIIKSPCGHQRCAIAMNFGLKACPWFTMFGPPYLYFVHLFVYVLHGRFAGYLPTISETGTGEFGHPFQFRAFPAISITTVFSEVVVGMYAIYRFPDAKFARFFMALFAALNGIGMCIVGMVQLHISRMIHAASAFLGFLFILLFQSVVYGLLFQDMSVRDKIKRLIYIVIEFLSLGVVALAEDFCDVRTCITWSTIGEYFLVEFIQGFLLSFWNELDQCQMFLSFEE